MEEPRRTAGTATGGLLEAAPRFAVQVPGGAAIGVAGPGGVAPAPARVMQGLHAIVGPSGVGKDTLMEAARARDPAVHLARRVITRPAAAGGEDFESVSEAEFARRLAAGDFVLHWRAHGLSYGIPGHVRAVLAAGRPVLFNGSRAALAEAVRTFPDLKVIHVTARPEVLRQRLLARGRESAKEVEERLGRSAISLPEGLEIFEIDNSGEIETAVDALLGILRGAAPAP